MQIETVTLKDGTEVKTSYVPVVLWSDAIRAALGEEPSPPKMDVKTVAGGVETVSMPHDSPEYIQYLQDKDAYDSARDKFVESFMWDAGVVSWKFPNTKRFVDQPPDDWEVSPVVKRMKLVDEHVDVRRVAYIRYGLLSDYNDNISVMKVIYGGTLLSSEEVDETVNMFQNQE